jgi:hypothetical protein
MKKLYTFLGRNTHKTNETGRSFRSGFGKIAITFAFFLISITNSFSQCTNCAAQYPAATQSINAGVSNQNISTCMFGGDYAICNVVSGSIYTWTTCGDTDFDTQITVRNNDGTCTGALYAYNDDFCNTQSQTSWTATFTGTVRVLVSKFSCANQSTCMTLNWSSSAPPCTVPSNPGFGTNIWNVIGYNGNDINLGAGLTRRGHYTESSLSFNSLNRWGTNDSPSNALGYNGCSVTTDNHTVVSKRTGVPTAGVYQIDVSTHDDAYLLLVNGSKSFENAYCCRTHSAIHTGYFNSSTTFEMRHADGGGGSNQGLTYTLQNLNASVSAVNPTTCVPANGSIVFSNPTGIVASPVFKSSFDNANGLTNYGNASVTGGTLSLTTNSNSLWGVSVLSNATNMNASSFNAEFDFRVWDGGGADGFSFNYAPSYPTANTYGNYESGIGNGLSISFYTYTGSGGPGLKVMYQGTQVGSSVYLAVRDAGYRQCVVSVNSNNQISVSVNGNIYISNLALPAAFLSTDKTNWQFGFAARTGGVNDRHNIDNVSINALNQFEFSIDGVNWTSSMQFNNLTGGTYTPSIRNKAFPLYPVSLSSVTIVNPPVPTITTQPNTTAREQCLNGSFPALNVSATPVSGVTYQWYREGSNANPPDIASSTLINGAISASYAPPATATHGNRYFFVVITNNCGSVISAWSGRHRVAAQPTAPTLNTTLTNPANGTSVCTASSIDVHLNNGGAGYSTTNRYRYSIDGGSTWLPDATGQSWSSAAPGTTNFIINATGATGSILVETKRTSTNSSCNDSGWSLRASWTVIAAPTVTANASSISPCVGQTVTLSGSGASGYTWSNGATTATQTVSPTTTTTFTLTGTDGNGCTNTDQVVITLPTAGTALAQNDENATCLVSENGWIDFYNLTTGNLVGSINSLGQDLGNVTITSYVDPTNALIPACINPNPSTSTTVMQRHWVITPTIQPTSNVLIRLPYSNAEFNLLAFEAFNNPNLNDDLPAETSIGLSKYSNGSASNVNSSALDNCGVGSSNYYSQTTNGLTSTYSSVNEKYVAFTIPGFSEFWLHGSATSSPLPVELISFQANCKEDKQVAVTWSTASEHNTSHFVVEKSRDGLNWITFNTLGAAGNSTSIIEYALTDNNEVSGTTYYRLTQFDTDGASETFNIASVNCGEQAATSNLVTYPNPSNGSFYLDFYTQDLTGPSLISVFDSRGVIVYRQDVLVEKGSNVFHIEKMDAAPGMYYIQVSNGTTTSYIVKHSLR